MHSDGRSIAVIGASRGIGAAVAHHFAQKGDRVVSVSRSRAVAGEWIQADISTPEGILPVADQLGDSSLDALLFMGGVWEDGAFTDNYSFMNSSDRETRHVIAVNTVAPIELTRQLAKNLVKTGNPRAIFIGALSGLDHAATPEVANTAAKSGLRGAVQALRLALRDFHIGFTVINPGNVATEEILADIDEGRFPQQVPIPLQDLISAIEWVLQLSWAADVSEINLQQKM
jgi:NAD(P)-dependent dehydrogenase (short-subunit alcohol dehydrogenase family)